MSIKNKRCIGIDPGVKGGIACVEKTRDGYRVQWVAAMPIVRAKDRPTVDMAKIARLFPVWDTPILIEIPSRGIGKNPSSQAALQFQCGQLCGYFWSADYRTVFPNVWRYGLRIPVAGGKQGNAAWARGILGPDCEQYFTGPRGGILDGIVDAALIAVYGLISQPIGKGEAG